MARLGPLLGAALLSAAMQAPAAEPAPQAGAALRLRVVGGLAGITQYAQLEAPFWTRDLARLSQGRFDADIVPFDRAGVPGMEMLRLLELGVVPFGTVFMSSLSDRYPQYMVAPETWVDPSYSSLENYARFHKPAPPREESK